MLGELTEVIMKSGWRTAIESGPERRLANRLATGKLQLDVIVGHAANHVGVRFDVVHRDNEMETLMLLRACATI